MSVTATSSSSATAYTNAYTLGAAALKKRYLAELGSAVEQGNLQKAKSGLNAIKNAFPEYRSTVVSPNSVGSDEIRVGFEALSKAIDEGDADAAKGSWAALKESMAKLGLTNFADSGQTASRAMSMLTRASNDTLMGAIFGRGQTDNTVSNLIGVRMAERDMSVGGIATRWLLGGDIEGGSLNGAVRGWLMYNSSGVPVWEGSVGTMLNAEV